MADAPLAEYRRKRAFDTTPEPAGSEKPRGKEPIFVIQKHAATRLHYDFRLEVDGVLKSWAVPKGPSTDPRDRRLAVPTEDHPLEYATFEGAIPAGEYGGGAVLVWDCGTYENLKRQNGDGEPMAESIRRGRVAIRLRGRKLRGGYALIRTAGAAGRWLLIKMRDDGADARRVPTSTEPASVISGKTIEDIMTEAQGAPDA